MDYAIYFWQSVHESLNYFKEKLLLVISYIASQFTCALSQAESKVDF
jgi:hypothetical protein